MTAMKIIFLDIDGVLNCRHLRIYIYEIQAVLVSGLFKQLVLMGMKHG